jgi:hypothetical protein
VAIVVVAQVAVGESSACGDRYYGHQDQEEDGGEAEEVQPARRCIQEPQEEGADEGCEKKVAPKKPKYTAKKHTAPKTKKTAKTPAVSRPRTFAEKLRDVNARIDVHGDDTENEAGGAEEADERDAGDAEEVESDAEEADERDAGDAEEVESDADSTSEQE